MDRGPQFALGNENYTAVGDLYQSIKSQYPDVKFGLQVRPTHVHLDTLIVPKENRGKGIGSSIMNALTREADARNWSLSVSPSTDFGSSMTRLNKFYHSHGFSKNSGKKADFNISAAMIRRPVNG